MSLRKKKGFSSLHTIFILMIIMLISAGSYKISINNIQKAKLREGFRDSNNLNEEAEEAISYVNYIINNYNDLPRNIQENKIYFTVKEGVTLSYNETYNRFYLVINKSFSQEILLKLVNNNEKIFLLPEKISKEALIK